MGWRPQPRFDSTRNRWHVNLKGRRYILGAAYPNAVKRFAEILAEVGMSGAVAPSKVPLTVAELVEDWLRWHPGDWRRWMVRPFFDFAGYARLHDLGDDTLDRYLRSLTRAKYAPQTIKHMVNHAARVLTHGVESEWLARAPKMPRLPTVPREPKDIDSATLGDIGAALENPCRARAARLIRFILETGCRPGEARGLTWRQVRYDKGICTIRDHKTRHHGKVRTIYLTPGAIKALKSASAADGIELDAPVFKSRLGKPYTSAGLRAILRRLGARPNQLRHTFAQHALLTLPLEDVSKLLGHAKTQTTQAYAHIQNQRAIEAAQSLASPLHRLPAAGPRGPRRASPPALRKTPQKTSRQSGTRRGPQSAKPATARRGSARGRSAGAA